MEKTYINWYVKETETKYGKIMNISINPSSLEELPRDKNGMVRISIMKRKSEWKYWETHYMVLNEYNPWEKKENKEENVDYPF